MKLNPVRYQIDVDTIPLIYHPDSNVVYENIRLKYNLSTFLIDGIYNSTEIFIQGKK